MNKLVCIFLFAASIFASSCNRTIDVKRFINLQKPLTLSIRDSTLIIGKTKELLPESERYKRLISWLDNNKSSWESTPASFVADVYVVQDDFRILYLQRQVVVVGFVENGEPKQYSKKTPEGELDFLIN